MRRFVIDCNQTVTMCRKQSFEAKDVVNYWKNYPLLKKGENYWKNLTSRVFRY